MNKLPTRRDFLRITGLGAALSALAACAPQPEAAPDAGSPSASPTAEPPLLDAEGLVLHTLRRTTFGPTADELARAQQLGLEAWLEQQLDPDSLDHGAVEARLAEFETLDMPAAELRDLNDNGRVAFELVGASLTRQMFSPAQLYEVMVDFWTNHFNIYAFTPPELYLKGRDDREVIRAHALGSFPEMLYASAHSPAMLVYLDNAQSRRPEPNENYARELLELHTLGVDGGYGYNDLQAVARAFTGWTIGEFRRGGDRAVEFNYLADWHDPDDKTVLGEILPGGERDGERVLEILAAHPSTARHLASKLVRRFVSDEPPESLVDTVADSYSQSGGDIPSMLRSIIYSEEFAASAGMKLKRPLEFAVSAVRVSGADGRLDRVLRRYLQLLGQVPYAWPAPDGYPDQAAAWTSTSQSLYRWNLALTLASCLVPGMSLDLPLLEGSASELIDGLSMHLLGEPLPSQAHRLLVDFAASLEGMTLPRRLELPNLLAGLVMCSPQFQLR